LIHFDDWGHADAIARLANTSFNRRTDRCISRTEYVRRIQGPALFGGSIISGYTGRGGSCGIHLAGTRTAWLSRTLLWVTYDYMFNQLGVARVVAQVPADNGRSIVFCLKNGFKELHKIEGIFPGGGALLVFVLERADCRYLNLRPSGLKSGHNGEQAEGTASA